jgi:hypothetical protein
MFSLTPDAGIADLVAAWPIVLLALAFVSLVAMAFVRAAHAAVPEVHDGWGEGDPRRICRAAGHHYLKRETGWRCSQCGDEIRLYVNNTRETLPAHRTRESADV